ncbi:MAG TPA: hypothetical protein VLZ83_11425 [Edaphocola sp.]|nr:hypothetical protein [Edaphocola sp.]
MGCLSLNILEQTFVPMQIRYKSALGIDPLADAGGQQVLSPYHAMGCNPAMMVDPFGLQGQTGMSTPGNDHFIMPFGYMVEGTYVYLSADRLGTGKGNAIKHLEAYIYNSMMEMAEAQQQKIIDIRFAAALEMINGYNTALQSLVSSYDIPGMMSSQMKSGYLGEYNNHTSERGAAYLTNNSDHTIYFKPETTMTIDGVEYDNGGSYELKAGETWKYGIDGVSAPHLGKGKVYKVSTGSTVVVTNDDIDYTSAGFKSWAGNVLQGGWLGESWLKNISADKVVHTTSNIFGFYTTTTDRPNRGDKSWINLFQSSGLPNTSQYRGFYIYRVGGFLMK